MGKRKNAFCADDASGCIWLHRVGFDGFVCPNVGGEGCGMSVFDLKSGLTGFVW